ncbi:hypothetical protein LWI28_028442 [Acer negundo]|uniref:Uncharacterized protein n=1 Tax=Acer negundo TaxID=4023 RepID=A0AAD5JBU8_ACENE|nr:hypothetical protein LWI28_028442 [Acer negundo]
MGSVEDYGNLENLLADKASASEGDLWLSSSKSLGLREGSDLSMAARALLRNDLKEISIASHPSARGEVDDNIIVVEKKEKREEEEKVRKKNRGMEEENKID